MILKLVSQCQSQEKKDTFEIKEKTTGQSSVYAPFMITKS